MAPSALFKDDSGNLCGQVLHDALTYHADAKHKSPFCAAKNPPHTHAEWEILEAVQSDMVLLLNLMRMIWVDV